MNDKILELTITQNDEGFYAELVCPAFVDSTDHDSVEDALSWAQIRLDGTNPFIPYKDDE